MHSLKPLPIWALLLDEEFLIAYKQGIVILCADGVLHRVFLRLFTYSADYPEKSGLQRDHKCCVTQSREDTHAQLSSISLTRQFIYGKSGYKVNSTAVNNLLQPTSLVPTENTFSTKMTSSSYNKFIMFVINLMHKFELGVWKAHTPTFGHDTICQFANNVSEMKKLATQDFEDILQCAMPAFEVLFPDPHEMIIQCLLFTLISWHSLAKLHRHTNSTLQLVFHSNSMSCDISLPTSLYSPALHLSRVNLNIGSPTLGMTRIDCRETHMHQISKQVEQAGISLSAQPHSHQVVTTKDDNLPYTDPKCRFHISPSQDYPLDLGHFLCLKYDGDETDFSEQDQDTIIIRSNCLYHHQIQDSINPRISHCYHPFWYARVLGIFHVNIKYIHGDSQWQPIPFLWIRWFGRCYDRIGFVTEDDDTEPFGFLDPTNIVHVSSHTSLFSRANH
ncbi:hypothetical protein K439DRAFT_1646676 [Ramaria rubella]|nr:hypothetical protein K439DRAFT_1646676 [Ramaria rubella]